MFFQEKQNILFLQKNNPPIPSAFSFNISHFAFPNISSFSVLFLSRRIFFSFSIYFHPLSSLIPIFNLNLRSFLWHFLLFISFFLSTRQTHSHISRESQQDLSVPKAVSCMLVQLFFEAIPLSTPNYMQVLIVWGKQKGLKTQTTIFAKLWKSACNWKAAKNAKVFTLWRCGKFLCDECLAAARWEDGKSVWSRVRPAFWVKCRWIADKMFALGCPLVKNDLGHTRTKLAFSVSFSYNPGTMFFLGVYQRINNKNWVATKVSALVFECHVLVSRKPNFINKWSGLCTGSHSFLVDFCIFQLLQFFPST